MVRPPPGNDVNRPDMFGVEKQNPAHPSGMQHMFKGSARVSPVRSAPKRPPNCAEKEKNRPAIHCEIGTDELSLGQQ